MGFIFGCLFVWLLISGVWRLIVSSHERVAFTKEFAEAPLRCIFISVWVIGFLMFFLGVFIPILGEIELGDTGWQVWQVGGVIFFVGFLVSQFLPNWP